MNQYCWHQTTYKQEKPSSDHTILTLIPAGPEIRANLTFFNFMNHKFPFIS